MPSLRLAEATRVIVWSSSEQEIMHYMQAFISRCVALLLLLPIAAVAQEVWFAPPDNLPRGARPPLYPDFPRLFDPSPAWSVQADVFVISPVMGSLPGQDEALRVIGSFLAKHHIALAVGIGTVQGDNVSPVPGECGLGIEGLNRPNRNAAAFERLKQLGIDVQYVAMDEPLTFGHYYNRKNACQYSIEDTARRVAASIAEIRRFYPDARVVDYEAPNIAPTHLWNTEFPVWLSAYHQATGAPLYAVVFDVDWRLPWLDWVSPSTVVAHKNGVRAGIFLNGIGPGASDADSISDRQLNALSLDEAKLPLDLVVVANWTVHPSRNLPESDPNTLTSFLRWYQTHRGLAK